MTAYSEGTYVVDTMEGMTAEEPVAVGDPKMRLGERRDSDRGYVPAQRLWPATPKGVHKARHALAGTLTEWGMPELCGQAGLVLSELMTNAQKHGSVPSRGIGTSFIPVEQGVRLEVHDSRGDVRPVLVRATELDEKGRGLAIVDSITNQRWGVTGRQGPGKIVWAVVLGALAVPALT
jgi:serine/threonine-protein kinase RsbW